MVRSAFFTSVNGRLWAIDLDGKKATRVQSGLIIDFVEEDETKGIWKGQARNLEVVESKGISLTELAALVRDATNAFVKALKHSKRV